MQADWHHSKRWGGTIAQMHYREAVLDWKVQLFLPDGWMNQSGIPIARSCQKMGIAPEHLLVVQDELDVPAGQVKLKFGGGDAGHNGLRSIRSCLGTGNYWRLRIGIGRPDTGAGDAVRNFVLSKPSPTMAPYLEQAVAQSTQIVAQHAGANWSDLMQHLHSKNQT